MSYDHANKRVQIEMTPTDARDFAEALVEEKGLVGIDEARAIWDAAAQAAGWGNRP